MRATCRSVTLVVLAAGGQASFFGGSSFSEDSGFLNVGTRLAIERISSFYASDVNIITLLAVANANRNIYHLSPYSSVRVIGVGETRSVTESLQAILKHVDTDWCLINPITAVPSSHLSSDGAVYFGQDLIPKENWSALTVGPGQEQFLFHPKSEQASAGLSSHPFTGRIFAKIEHISRILEELDDSQQKDLLHIGQQLIAKQQAIVRYEKWIDAGHQATYAESKLHSISSRFFNSLSYIPATSTIIKKSSEVDKLRLEAKLIEQAPPQIKRFFPAILRSSGRDESWEVEMEYVGYPSLAEVFLYGNIGPNTWRRIIDALGQAYDAFYASEKVVQENASWLYSEKTMTRLAMLERLIAAQPDHSLARIFEHPFTVNGLSLPSLRESFSLMVDVCHELEASCELHVGHGDLCFNNILVDPLYGSLKLIDPKAAIHPGTGQLGLMHGLYDLAKLNHSFVGLYDSIVNRLYRLSCADDTHFEAQIYAPPNCHDICRMFQNRLLLERSDELACTQATANLFLSMLPLHQEDQQRMLMFAIVGSVLLSYGKLNQLLMNP